MAIFDLSILAQAEDGTGSVPITCRLARAMERVVQEKSMTDWALCITRCQITKTFRDIQVA